jgi:hypothetical protein
MKGSTSRRQNKKNFRIVCERVRYSDYSGSGPIIIAL